MGTKLEVTGIIQARMGSARLPSKMMKNLGGIPILEWVIKRARSAKSIDKLVVATSQLKEDDLIEQLASSLKVIVFRGSEKNVLKRFVDAAKFAKAKNIIRICADNPFIDPYEIDRLAKYFFEKKCDYAFNHQNRFDTNYADGFGAEIFSFSTLKKILTAAVDESHYEHVTKYIWDNASAYNIGAIMAPNELAYPDLRFDVDSEQDLLYLQYLVDSGVSIQSRAAEIVKIALSKSQNTYIYTTRAKI